MLESINDYASLLVIVAILLLFIVIAVVYFLRFVERKRIEKAMKRREAELKGEI